MDLDKLKKLYHPNTVIIYESELKRCLTGWNLYILMEYVIGGTLVDSLKNEELLDYISTWEDFT